MKGILYCIENSINQKQYIGKTYGTIEERWRQHLEESSKDRSSNRPLYRAINKYGKENFEIFSLGTYEEGFLEDAEINAIILYKTYAGDGSGYNATLGGDGRRYLTFSEEEVLITYGKLQNVTKTAEVYKCDRQTISNILTKNKVKIAQVLNNKSIKIIELSLEFNSIADAASFLIEKGYTDGNFQSVRQGISRHLKGDRASYLGMHFEV